MDTSKLNLFVYDSKENFEKTKTQIGFEGSTLKRLINIETINELEQYLQNQLDDGDLVFLVVHVFALEKIKGIKQFLASGIREKYPSLEFMYISDGASDKEIRKLMVDSDIETSPVFNYHHVLAKLRADEFAVKTKKELLQLQTDAFPIFLPNSTQSPTSEYPVCDYAIITALEETEMEKVLRMLTKTGKIENRKHLIEYGYLTANPKKTIVYASQLRTGMVDAAVLATELIIRFKPKFLIMAGVLGGKPDEVKIGDVVVATKVITIDAGKISDVGFKPEIESSDNDNAYITKIKREKEKIISYIKEEDSTRDERINIHFGPICCVRQVIDLEGFFEEKITPVERKAIALEMESYGISRACTLINDGNTEALIIKSAMDNTKDKVDNAKPFAASTSAWAVRYILENDLI